MRLPPILAILALLAAAACEPSTDLAGVSEETFVRTMADLRRIERDITLDSVQKAEARDAALQERNLTPAELEAAARALADDAPRAVSVWARIDTLAMFDEPPETADTAAAP